MKKILLIGLAFVSVFDADAMMPERPDISSGSGVRRLQAMVDWADQVVGYCSDNSINIPERPDVSRGPVGTRLQAMVAWADQAQQAYDVWHQQQQQPQNPGSQPGSASQSSQSSGNVSPSSSSVSVVMAAPVLVEYQQVFPNFPQGAFDGLNKIKGAPGVNKGDWDGVVQALKSIGVNAPQGVSMNGDSLQDLKGDTLNGLFVDPQSGSGTHYFDDDAEFTHKDGGKSFSAYLRGNLDKNTALPILLVLASTLNDWGTDNDSNKRLLNVTQLVVEATDNLVRAQQVVNP